MRILNGKEIAEFVKERQLKQARALIQAEHVQPKLAIVKTIGSPVIDTYIRLKQQYGEDVQIETEVFTVKQDDIIDVIDNLNADSHIHGIIVQLPLEDEELTDSVVGRIASEKDVDGMRGLDNGLDPATAMAINWLLAAYNVDVAKKKVAIVGRGRLVGKPLEIMWLRSGVDVTVFDKDDGKNLADLINYDIVVSATGQPGLITSDMLAKDAVAVDAGTASQGGQIVGDFDESVRERTDLTITPVKGGVGPLTIAALFDNVLRATRAVVLARNKSEGDNGESLGE